jgi:hypothetical protein
MKPTGKRVPLVDARRHAGQDKKGSLEGILCVLFLAQHRAAHAKNEAAMPFQKSSKGDLVLAGDELL